VISLIELQNIKRAIERKNGVKTRCIEITCFASILLLGAIAAINLF